MAETKTPPAPASTDGGLVARLAAQKQHFKAAWKAVTDRSAELEKTVKVLTAENTELKGKADTSEVAKKLDAKIAELRQIKHQQAFNRAALAKGADPKLLDDLWTLAGVKPEADEPDLEKLGMLIDEQKAARAWAFGAEVPPPDPNAPPPLKPAVGSGQGGGFKVSGNPSDHDPSDVAYWFNNYDRIAEGSKEKIARGQV